MGILHDHGHVAVPKNPLKRMDATPIHHVVTGEGVPKNLGELLRNGPKGQGRRLEYSAPCYQDSKGCDARRDPFLLVDYKLSITRTGSASQRRQSPY